MFKQRISFETWGSDSGGKYRLVDNNKNPVDQTPQDTCNRVAKELASIEKDSEYWYKEFQRILGYKFAGGGRIMANIGASKYKKETSPINCVVSRQIPDSMHGIMSVALEASLILKFGCGIGYDFSTIRPKGAQVSGAGAVTSGVLSFMKIFDVVCSTVMSGGGRRGAQIGCLDIQHPEIEDFISAKREDGALRYFNLSVLITDEFMNAVKLNKDWNLWFWQKTDESVNEKIKIIRKNDIPYNYPKSNYFSFAEDHVEVIYSKVSPNDVFKKKIFKTVRAKDLYDLITKSTYTYSDPGFILIDKMNKENNLWFEETIRATNPCQPSWATILTPNGVSTIGDIKVGDIIWGGQRWTTVVNKIYTGIKPVYAYHTLAGTFYGTENHRVLQKGEKVEVKDAKSIDISPLPNQTILLKTADIKETQFVSEEDVYDITVDALEHTYWSGGLLVSNCGEQPLSPMSNCLLGSILLCSYIKDEFKDNASFDWDSFKKDIRVAARLLDNVVEFHNLPFKELGDNLRYQRRHGMGFTGLGSALNMLCIKYNSQEGLDFAKKLSLTLAQENLLAGIELAKEKGSAPFAESIKNRKLFLQSEYNKRLLDTFPNKDQIINQIIEHGIRWSHATSMAPTGTMSLVWGNNCSNGLEPVFDNSYLRNFRISGKKTKVQEEVFDYAFFEYKKLYPNQQLPPYWITADQLSVDDHINMQSVIQLFADSSCSKTINIPTTYTYEDFKDVYFKGWEKGLKGLTTFRYNPEIHGGVLIRKEDIENTYYKFTLEDGAEISVKGNEQIEYDGETHVVANLFDALKEGIYGNM
jgi:ribonucleotide reductase alpha subunit